MGKNIPTGFYFKQIHDRLEKHANNNLKIHDLTMMQFSVLMALNKANNQQLSMKELEQYFGVSQPTIVGIISRLEQKNFVEAQNDASDKRVKLVHLTQAGKECCQEGRCCMDEAESMILKGFSSEEQLLLNQMLARIAQNLE